MAKGVRKISAINVSNNKGVGASYEHQETFDDSLLPDAVELSKLQALDPNAIEWIKARTEKEQDQRHNYSNRKISLLEVSAKRTHNTNILTIILAFIIIIVGMAFSAFLIYQGLNIAGSVFAGITVLLAANAFLKFDPAKK